MKMIDPETITEFVDDVIALEECAGKAPTVLVSRVMFLIADAKKLKAEMVPDDQPSDSDLPLVITGQGEYTKVWPKQPGN